MSTYQAGTAIARYHLSLESIKEAAECLRRAIEDADRASVAAMDQQTFLARRQRFLAEGRIYEARRLEEDFTYARRRCGEGL